MNQSIEEKKVLEALYLKEERSIREVANFLDLSKDKVHRLLISYGIKREKRIRKGKLSGLTLEYLEREFKNKSKIQIAKDLGVSRQSLHERYLKLKKDEQ